MKKIWLHTVRGYIRLGLFFYYKTIKTFNTESIPTDRPILFLANHQNALLDALLIATSNKRFAFFLTRAAVFNSQIIGKLLRSLNMIPVYRIRDGWSSISNNNAIFSECTDLLNQGEAVAMFPEGNHNLKRMVRPLSKGFTRIVFGVLDTYPKLNFQLIPVGLNYKHPLYTGDSVSIFYGKPIDAKLFNSDDRNENVNNLKKHVFNELTKLTTHIPQENYTSILKELENLNVDFLNPEAVNICIQSDFDNCKVNSEKINRVKYFFKIALIILLIVPYVIWKFGVQPKIKEPEFISTFRFAVAITFVPVYIFMVMFILFNLYGLQMAFLYFICVLSSQLSFVKF